MLPLSHRCRLITLVKIWGHFTNYAPKTVSYTDIRTNRYYTDDYSDDDSSDGDKTQILLGCKMFYEMSYRLNAVVGLLQLLA